MKTYKINHRVGSYYMTTTSPVIKAKNGIQALRRAIETAKHYFKNDPNLDLRVVKCGENYCYDSEPIWRRYCIGLDKNKEHYFEIEPINP